MDSVNLRRNRKVYLAESELKVERSNPDLGCEFTNYIRERKIMGYVIHRGLIASRLIDFLIPSNIDHTEN